MCSKARSTDRDLVRTPSSEAGPAAREQTPVASGAGLGVPQWGEAKTSRKRLLIVASHVVQYSSPVFRQLAQDPRMDLLVSYCSMQGADSGVDPGFGVKVSWDMPFLE